MVKDEEVDIVYVANVHIAHKATCLPLLAAGKNVLCEKPLSVNAKETREIYKAADDSKKFFLVGLWSRFFPAQQKCAVKATMMPCWTASEQSCVHGIASTQLGAAGCRNEQELNRGNA